MRPSVLSLSLLNILVLCAAHAQVTTGAISGTARRNERRGSGSFRYVNQSANQCHSADTHECARRFLLSVQFADRIKDGNLTGSERGPDRWFDTTAFARPAVGTLGSSGRNVLLGPGPRNVDVSILKNTYVTADGNPAGGQARES